MALVLNEEQTMLREAAKNFLNGRAPVSHLRQLRDDDVTEGFSRELWAEMAEMGWAAIIIPETYGGLDYGCTFRERSSRKRAYCGSFTMPG